MDKDRIQSIADAIAQEDYGQEFYDLSPKLQIKVYEIAMDRLSDMMADKADMMRKGEKDGGRIGYSEGSEDYEEKFMKLVSELREAGFSQQEAIEEARERLSKDMAYGGLIDKPLGPGGKKKKKKSKK